MRRSATDSYDASGRNVRRYTTEEKMKNARP
jgi:hypothetical protein